MFHADWIIQQAGPAPDPTRERRPALVRSGQRGKQIRPAWPLIGELRDLSGKYPGEVSALDFAKSSADISPQLEQPGTDVWAAALATIDEPAVAIPLIGLAHTVRFVRAFETAGDQLLVVSIDVAAVPEHRNRPTRGVLGDVRVIRAARPAAEEQLRELLEDAYVHADPGMRDRILRADDEPEPVVLVIAADVAIRHEASAVAATFGMTVDFVTENIAQDTPRLVRVIEASGNRLFAAFLCEPGTDRLVWVADFIRLRAADATTERYSVSGPVLRAAMRRDLTAVAAGTFAPAPPETVRTCRRCQPDVERALEHECLAVGTVAAPERGECICGGVDAESLAIRLRLAVHLAEIDDLLIIGWQENFGAALAAVTNADIRHLHNAGPAKEAVKRAEFVVIVTGSVMGHSDTQKLVDEIRHQGVDVFRTSSSQLNDVVKAVFEEAVRRRPELASAQRTAAAVS